MHRILNSLKSWTFWIPFAMFMATSMGLRAVGVNIFITLAAAILVQVVAIVVVAFVEVTLDAKKREEVFKGSESETSETSV